MPNFEKPNQEQGPSDKVDSKKKSKAGAEAKIVRDGIRNIINNPDSEILTVEEEDFLKHQEIHYKDNQFAIRVDQPGESIKWREHKWFNPDNSINLIIIKTSSGNRYIMGRGIIVNEKENNARRIQEELPDLTIGKPWGVPGVFHTTSVESVISRYKIGESSSSSVEETDEENPFPKAAKLLEVANKVLPPPKY